MDNQEKTTIKLKSGQIVDCGIKEKENLHQAIKNKNPQEIVANSIKLLGSSETMSKELTDSLFKALEEFKETKVTKHNVDELMCKARDKKEKQNSELYKKVDKQFYQSINKLQ